MSGNAFEFALRSTDGLARLGSSAHLTGVVQTPAFMPVGHAGQRQARCVTATSRRQGLEIILGNTYHLYLAPRG